MLCSTRLGIAISALFRPEPHRRRKEAPHAIRRCAIRACSWITSAKKERLPPGDLNCRDTQERTILDYRIFKCRDQRDITASSKIGCGSLGITSSAAEEPTAAPRSCTDPKRPEISVSRRLASWTKPRCFPFTRCSRQVSIREIAFRTISDRVMFSDFATLFNTSANSWLISR
jgi:hypothetical protein